MVFAHCSKTWLDLPHPPENLENGPNVGDMQHLTLARTGGGGLFRAPLWVSSRISSKPMQVSPPNLQYPLSQQFDYIVLKF